MSMDQLREKNRELLAERERLKVVVEHFVGAFQGAGAGDAYINDLRRWFLDKAIKRADAWAIVDGRVVENMYIEVDWEHSAIKGSSIPSRVLDSNPMNIANDLYRAVISFLDAVAKHREKSLKFSVYVADTLSLKEFCERYGAAPAPHYDRMWLSPPVTSDTAPHRMCITSGLPELSAGHRTATAT